MPNDPGMFRRLAHLREDGVRVADEPTGKALLRELGIAVPQARLASSAAEAADVAAEIGFPLAVKLVSYNLFHKSDIGGVVGPCFSSVEVAQATDRILRQSPHTRAVLVERWRDDGIACFLGLSFETSFGPVVSFGLGGIWVELIRDVTHRLAPVTVPEAEDMIRGLRGALLLSGRTRSALSRRSLAEAIARLSELAASQEARAVLAELEVNPLMVGPDAAPFALDCKAVLRPPQRPVSDRLVGIDTTTN